MERTFVCTYMCLYVTVKVYRHMPTRRYTGECLPLFIQLSPHARKPTSGRIEHVHWIVQYGLLPQELEHPTPDLLKTVVLHDLLRGRMLIQVGQEKKQQTIVTSEVGIEGFYRCSGAPVFTERQSGTRDEWSCIDAVFVCIVHVGGVPSTPSFLAHRAESARTSGKNL